MTDPVGAPAATGVDVDVYVVGLGLRADQLTPQVRRALGRSRQVLYVSHVPGTAELLRGCCDDAVDLAAACYREGGDRAAAYRAMAAAVVDAAIAGPPVTFALYGHPLVLAQPSTIVLGLARRLGLRAEVLPGVSSLDCLLADLGVDLMAAGGIQMHEATELMLYGRRLLPELATVIWQAGLLETRIHSHRGSTPARLARFAAYLRRFYPSSHEVVAVASSVDPAQPAEVHRFALAGLEERAWLLHPGSTLYLAPVSAPVVADPELEGRLGDAGHLARITAPA